MRCASAQAKRAVISTALAGLAVAAGMFLVALAVGERPASAAFPGKNGKIAFVSTRDGNEEIYVMDADGTNETRLTTDPETEPGRDIHPMFSPDGKRLTFTRRPFIGGVTEETIYVMDPIDVNPEDGSGDHLTKLTPASPPNFMSAFSPDGSRMVFQRQEPPGSDNEIWVMNADGTNPVQLTDNNLLEGRPVFSPDGTKIVYSRRGLPGTPASVRQLDIYVMSADGTQQTRLTTSLANDNNPRFSPDGTKIAFESTRDGNSEIYVMNPDGTDQTRLISDPSDEVFPAFSPDGEQLAFSSDRDGNAEIYVTNANGSNPIQITETDPPVENIRADWGPFPDNFDGFHRPVDNPPISNEVRAGSAVPVKFSLGGEQGLGILGADYPKSQQIDCDSEVPVDILEQTATAGESGLSYDEATGEYTYVWKTRKAWAGTCRQLAVKLDDSTVHWASFTFK
jgi:Tol biopolymer transport system component